jgi:uncharacterized repeat protein (TIGR01451 family)
MRHVVDLTWRRRLAAAALTSVVLVLALAAGAFADAGNPITGTIKYTAVDNGSTVTVYVRGQWNWLSHGSDCNVDRAATGVGIIWNDFNGTFGSSGSPQRGANEVQKIALSGTVTNATFKVTFKNPAGTNATSALISSGDSAATLQSKLEAMASIGAGNVIVSGGPGTTTPWSVQFTGALARQDVNAMAAANKSAGLTVTISTTSAGAAPVYNGYLVANGGISAYVGTKTATAQNVQDQMVHPVDRGNQVEGYRTAGSDYPANQPFFDPPSNSITATSTWKGGCGRLPLSATASPKTPPGTDPGYGESTARQCATTPGSGVCAAEPWGSWGYEKCNTASVAGGPCTAAPRPSTMSFPYGYSHTYLKTLADGSSGLPEKICVNFYDVHTQTSGSYIPKSGDITVDANGDNSIDTNAFNVMDTAQGGNCISISLQPSITTTATDASVGGAIHDTAQLSNIPANAVGTLTFKAYKRTGANADCSGGAAFTSTVNVTGPGSYSSDDTSKGGSVFTPAHAGTYDWAVDYSGDPAHSVSPVSSACGDQSPPNDETSDVAKRSPTLTTDASPLTLTVDTQHGSGLTDNGILTGGYQMTGPITFTLYDDANCTHAVGTATATVSGNSGTFTSGPPVMIDAAGTYRWRATYAGDQDNFAAGPTACNDPMETVVASAASIHVTKTADAASVDAGDPIGFTITVSNSGGGLAEGVTLSDPLPADPGTSWTIAGGTYASVTTCGIGSGTLTCGPSNLAAGASYTVHITSPTTQATAAASPVDNTASVTTTNDGNDSANASVTLLGTSKADTKTANPAGPVSAGETIGFDITVTNPGPGKANGVVATDALPTDAGTSWSIFTQDGTACSIGGGTLTCSIGTMSSGASYHVRITSPTTKDTPADSPVQNSVHVATTNDGSDDANAEVAVLAADVAVTKVADALVVSAGDTLGFTIQVKNTGPGKALGVVATDTLPTDADTVWTIAGQDTPGVCAISSGVMTCTIGTLDAGATYNVHITSPTTKNTVANSPVDNTVDVTTTNDGNPSANASVIVQGAQIGVTKHEDAASVSAGTPIGFTIMVSNAGPGVATGVIATDALPTDGGLDWSIDTQDGTACTIGGGILTCTIGSLYAGATYTVHITSPTTQATAETSPVDNHVHVTTTNDGTADADASVQVLGSSIAVLKTADNPTVSAGDQIGFTIKVTNPGPGTLTGVVATDTLPADAGLDWSIATQDGTACAIAGGLLTCTIGTMSPATSYSVHITSPTTSATPNDSPVDNHVHVSTSNDGTADDDESIEVLGTQIAVLKTADAATVSAGDQIGFTIKITNPGPGKAYDVTATDTLPTDAGLDWSIDTQDGTACSLAGGTLTCTVGTMGPSTSYSVHISSPTTQATASTSPVDNHVHVTTSNDGTADDDASVEVLGSSVAVLKTADESVVSAGDQIGFTIKITNPGPGTLTGVVLSDILPTDAGLDWSIDFQDGSECLLAGGALSCILPVMAPGSYTVHITSPTTKETPADSPVDNHVHVTTINDGTADDDESITVLGTHVSVTKTADNPSVSAGDQIGFTIKVTNPGPAKAYGVTATDTLPTDAGLAWSIDTQDGTACSIGGGTLTCDIGTMDPSTSYTVHITSTTTGATANDSPVDNHVHVTTSNDGTADDDESIEIRAAAIDVVKTADDQYVNAGDTIGFTVLVKNTGDGTAHGVTLTDSLPGGSGTGVTWVKDGSTGDPAAFALSGPQGSQTLTLAGQPLDVAPHTTLKVHITAQTSNGECTSYDNTASVSTSNDGQQTSHATIYCLATQMAVKDVLTGLPATASGTIAYTAYHSQADCVAKANGADATPANNTVSGGVVPQSETVVVGHDAAFGDTVWFTATFTPTGGTPFTSSCTETASTNP